MAIHQGLNARGTRPTDQRGIDVRSPAGDRDPGLTGAQVIDPRGQKIGRITDVVYDGTHAWPNWVVVKAGWFRGEHFVPVRGSYRTGSNRIVVPFGRRQVYSSPRAESDHVIPAQTRSMLVRHYHVADCL